jgi:hypothetical protein
MDSIEAIDEAAITGQGGDEEARDPISGGQRARHEPPGLDREARSIHVELKRSGYRDRFDFVTRWAAEPIDLLRELRELRPTIVHFSGHGARASTMDPAHDRDVVVPVRLVLLNACYTAPVAEALLAHVDCVVGT